MAVTPMEPLTVDRVVSAMLDAATALFDASACWMFLHDPATHTLAAAAYRGPAAALFAGVRVPVDAGIIGLVFQRREAVFVPEVSEGPRWFDPTRTTQSGIRSVFAAPMIADASILGVVGLHSPRFSASQPPDDRDISRLQDVAALAGLGLRHARMCGEIGASPLTPKAVRFADAERQAILQAVELAGWRISGAGGAAEILGLKPTTLHAKMKKLGIRRPSGAVGSTLAFEAAS